MLNHFYSSSSQNFTVICKICSKPTILSKNKEFSPFKEIQNQLGESSNHLSDTVKRLKTQMNEKKQILIGNLGNLNEKETSNLKNKANEEEGEIYPLHPPEKTFQIPALLKDRENFDKKEGFNEENSNLIELEKSSNSLTDTIKRLKSQIKQKKETNLNKRKEKMENSQNEISDNNKKAKYICQNNSNIENFNKNTFTASRLNDKFKVSKEYFKISNDTPQISYENMQNCKNIQNYKMENNSLTDVEPNIEDVRLSTELFKLSNQSATEINESFNISEKIDHSKQKDSSSFNENSNAQPKTSDLHNNEHQDNLINSLTSPKFAETCNQLNNPLLCCIHKEEITLFCLEDKSLCCTNCLFPNKNHKNHKILPISKAAKIILEESRVIHTNSLKNSQKILENELMKTQVNRTFLNSNREASLNQIKENFDFIYQSLRIREEKLKDEVEEFFNRKSKELETKISNLLYLKSSFCEKNMENLHFDEENTLKNIAFMQFYREFSKNVANLSQEDILRDLDVKLIDFNENQKIKLIDSLNSFGKIMKIPQKKSPTKINGQDVLVISKPLNQNQILKNNSNFHRKNNSIGGFNNNDQNLKAAIPNIQNNSKLLGSPLRSSKVDADNKILNFSNTLKKTSKSPLKRLNSERKSTSSLKFSIENKDLFFDSYILKKELRIPKVFSCLLPEELLTKTIDNNVIYSRLLYRLSRDGMGSLTFHLKCDGKTPLVGIIQVGKSIFGFFSDVPFRQIEDLAEFEGSFWLFSVRNKLGFHPMKFIKKKDCLNFLQRKESPIFGKYDLFIK